ncbi:MAG: alanine--tRNA ligase [Planctomycetota bacterium]|nr:alanine--tRNA ligase [Planctomycetota bacterium]MEE3295876.1 alanine--tRNA ligase [Planctomycetota bacterium]
MKTSEVRDKFLNYFSDRDHAVLPSSPSIPHGDKTLLFTNAGMVQFKDIFTGREERSHPRAATVQKCVRAGGKHNDLDNVGYTSRHLTLFEMLGNFSFGDYFKKEAISFAWELITEGYGLDPAGLWATVFREDDEAWELWKEISGLPDDRIVRLGEKDNYWSMGDVGPCGPCSEILLDRGDAFGEADVENGERFFELWNLVFMQFSQSADGEKTPLPQPSIDTGMGLERMAMVMQGVDTVYETDVLRGLIREVEKLTGVAYDPGEKGVPHRVLADHVRSLAFCLADGAEISNEGRGYVLRRILRRAARYGRKLHAEGSILNRLVSVVVDSMGGAYPELVDNQEFITEVVRSEEDRFGKTLDRGIELFENEIGRMSGAGEKTVSGEKMYLLWDSYGFPADLTQRMAEEAGFGVDMERFEECMGEQRERSRQASDFSVTTSFDSLPETEFVGYESLGCEGELQAVEEADGLLQVVLSRSPFYGESGGQVGDQGVISGANFRLAVENTQRDGGRMIHVCRLVEGEAGELAAGAAVKAEVDAAARRATECNHSATHLLHAALRETLGEHVHQKGSLVDPSRLRFDVTHFSGIEPKELQRAQELVNSQVRANLPVEISEMDKDEAIEQGAMAFFGEKYGDRVRVVRMGDFSVELCGGTHVSRTGDIGFFTLTSEGSVSSGVRRVEALTAGQAEGWFDGRVQLVDDLSKLLKVSSDRVEERVSRLLKENKELKTKGPAPAPAAAGDLEKKKIGDILFVSGIFDGLDGKGLRDCFDRVKKESDKVIAVLIAPGEGKVQVLVAVTPSLTAEGWKAADVFQAGAEHIEARGGGRPEMVQAGGKNPEGARAALEAMEGRVGQGPGE